MRTFKRFLLKTLLLALCLTGAWLYWEYRHTQIEQAIETELQNKDYEALLVRFEKLTPAKVAKGKTREGFYKALALNQSGDTDSAVAFWQSVLDASQDMEEQAESAYQLALFSQSQDDSEKAMRYLQHRSLANPSSPLFVESRLEIGRIHQTQKHLEKAKEVLQPLLIPPLPRSTSLDAVKKLLGKINISMTHSRRIYSNSTDYTIQPGDNLDSIAKKWGTTVELIQQTNSLKSSVIRPRNHLKIITGKFSIQVNKDENTLTLLENDKFFKQYDVGTGKDNTTPIGDFKITGKQKKPTWYHPDGSIIPFGSPENLLGTCWMSIDYPGYGIHGTWEPETIGSQSSAGCIRLHNNDVEELFTLISVGTRVLITD